MSIGLAVIGAGYWGPNLVRTALATPGFRLDWLCDLQVERARAVLGPYTTVRPTDSYDAVLADPAVAAVAIATPAATHFDLVRGALEAGKHVLVEKPLTPSVAEGEKLASLADRSGLVLMCDHTYCYTPAVQRIRELIRGGEIGDVQFIDSVRINLGLVQPDVDVLWDLAPHDLSILDFVLPEDVTPVGGGGPRRRSDRNRPGLPGVPVGLAVERSPRTHSRELAEPDQDPDNGVRRLAPHHRLGRHQPGRTAGRPRPGGRHAAGRRRSSGRAAPGPHLLPDRRHADPGPARAGGAHVRHGRVQRGDRRTRPPLTERRRACACSGCWRRRRGAWTAAARGSP